MLSAARVASDRREKALQSRQYDEKSGTYTICLQRNQFVKCVGSVQLAVKQGSVEIWKAIVTPETGTLDKIWLNGQGEIMTALEDDTVVIFSPSNADWNRIVQYAPIVRGFFPGREDADFNIIMGPHHDAILSSDIEQTDIVDTREKCKETWDSFNPDMKSLLIVGPKSSGKSSFARYLANQKLAEYGQNSVAFLELDPGQPELGPPGTLSLHLINEPLIGASFCSTAKNRHKLMKMHFLGHITPRDQHILYISLVENLVATYREMAEVPLLIVNTPGWIKGFGLDLILQIRDILGSETQCIYMKTFTDESIIPGAISIPSIQEMESTADNYSSNNEKSNRLNAQDSRMLQMMTYFNGYPKNWVHLTERTPYIIPLDGIAGIAVWNSELLSTKDLKIILPGTLVALLNVSDELFPLNLTDGGLVAESHLQPEFIECAGYAVVQSVETNENDEIVALRLIIPDSVDLSSLDPSKIVIARGKLQLSIYEMWNPKLDNTDAPYLTNEVHGVGSSQWRVRRNIQRKGHNI